MVAPAAHSGPDVLLVEDDRDDAELTLRALRFADASASVEHLVDGADAMARLVAPAARPRLVLLDLRLPGCSGFEILERLAAPSASAAPVVVVLSSSAEPEDVRRAYHMGAHGYLVKPGSTAERRTQMRAVVDFWLRHNVVDVPGALGPP